MERKLQLGTEENNKLQIEIERLNNHTSKLKASNFELNQNIEAAMEKCEELTCERASLAEQLDLMEASHAEERLKLEATNSQQTKLIDFLQCKAEGQAPKKKKVWTFLNVPKLGKGRGVSCVMVSFSVLVKSELKLQLCILRHLLSFLEFWKKISTDSIKKKIKRDRFGVFFDNVARLLEKISCNSCPSLPSKAKDDTYS